MVVCINPVFHAVGNDPELIECAIIAGHIVGIERDLQCLLFFGIGEFLEPEEFGTGRPLFDLRLDGLELFLRKGQDRDILIVVVKAEEIVFRQSAFFIPPGCIVVTEHAVARNLIGDRFGTAVSVVAVEEEAATGAALFSAFCVGRISYCDGFSEYIRYE